LYISTSHGWEGKFVGLNGFSINLTAAWQTFTHEFKSRGFANTTNNGRLRFWLVTAQPGDTI
jgi:hypothetical protein